MTKPTGLYFPGTSGHTVSTPDAASLDASSCSAIVKVALTDWTPAAYTTLIGRHTGAGDLNQWRLVVDTSGYLRVSLYFEWAVSTALPSVLDGEILWVGFTMVDSASVKFWTSVDGITWSQLGTTISHARTRSTGTSLLSIANTALEFLNGTIYEAQYFTGVGADTAPGQGTLVAEFNASAPVEPRYRDTTGKIWTINGSAYAWKEAP